MTVMGVPIHGVATGVASLQVKHFGRLTTELGRHVGHKIDPLIQVHRCNSLVGAVLSGGWGPSVTIDASSYIPSQRRTTRPKRPSPPLTCARPTRTADRCG